MHIVSAFVIPSLVIFMMIIAGVGFSDFRRAAVVVPMLAWSRRQGGDCAAA